MFTERTKNTNESTAIKRSPSIIKHVTYFEQVDVVHLGCK